jgi:hypothetical protein
MSLDTYTSLKSSITDWLQGRTDLAAVVDDFIDLAEAEMNRVLRVRDMEASDDLTLDSNGEATLPTDYLAWRTVTALTSPRIEVEYATPSYIEDTYGDRGSGYPFVFTIRGSTILVLPISTYDVRLDYYQRIPALSDSNTTNWLLTKMPGLYLHLALKHAAIYLDNQGLAQQYAMLAQSDLDALQRDDQIGRYSRARARVSGPTP